MQLYVKCAVCGGDGRQLVDLPCGCCVMTEDCAMCDGEGYVEAIDLAAVNPTPSE